MSFEGNFGVPKQEGASNGNLEELATLRKKQLNGDYTDTDRERLLELQNDQANEREISEGERSRFIELSKKQLSSELNSSESDELAALYRKIEGSR